jgi:two-component sensor histidine kinase
MTDQPGAPDATVAIFSGEPTSVSAARRHVAEQFGKWGADDQAAVASLIVSELATNAVKYANSGFEVKLTRNEHCVRIVVNDRSVEPPVRRDADAYYSSGYGLAIVDELSSRWGWSLNARGKGVWADLDVSPDSGAP